MPNGVSLQAYHLHLETGLLLCAQASSTVHASKSHKDADMKNSAIESYQSSLQHGHLVRRYKRFLADIRLDDGREFTAHCVNPGRMTGCSTPGSEVLVEAKQTGKLPYRLEQIFADGQWIGVNPQRANRVVEQALHAQALKPFAKLKFERAEASLPGGGSRIDFLLSDDDKRPLWLEVKSVTYVVQGHAMFPDAVTARGRKHLLHLAERVKMGERAAVLFLVQRADAHVVGPAAHIDPAFAETFAQVQQLGLETYGFLTDVQPHGLQVTRQVPPDLFDCASFSD